MEIRPFRAEVSEAVLHDLRFRLERTRLPREKGEPGEARGSGIDLEELAAFCDHWREDFDWRAVEDRINGFPNFRAEIDGPGIHFVRADGRGPRPLPILITHGWPGSFLEMLNLVPLLTDPGSHGADPADSFDVVVPSIPGYGFSDAGGPGTTPRRIAEIWRALMQGLGYARFGLQGGDWGASVATWLGRDHPEVVAGIHLNYVPGSYSPDLGPGSRPLTDAERAFLAGREEWLEREGGYAHIQATSPSTLAAALNDSPAGLAAWSWRSSRAGAIAEAGWRAASRRTSFSPT